MNLVWTNDGIPANALDRDVPAQNCGEHRYPFHFVIFSKERSIARAMNIELKICTEAFSISLISFWGDPPMRCM